MQCPFNAAEIRGRLKAGRSTVNGFLPELEDKQFLELVEVAPSGRGRPSKEWKTTDREVDAEDVLPSMEDLFGRLEAGESNTKIPPESRGNVSQRKTAVLER